jgi:hypothetical protein
MRNKQYLYHSSKTQGLKELKPHISDFERVFVYAKNSIVFSAIFSNTPGGSIEATWGKSALGIPYYCERFAEVFDRNYYKQRASIYFLEAQLF